MAHVALLPCVNFVHFILRPRLLKTQIHVWACFPDVLGKVADISKNMYFFYETHHFKKLALSLVVTDFIYLFIYLFILLCVRMIRTRIGY